MTMMQEHEHEPLPGSVWDAEGHWRPTAEQAQPDRYGVVFPLAGQCRVCEQRITRGRDEAWSLRSTGR